MLARAFDDDPVQLWAYPRPRARERYGGAFFRWELWRHADQGVTWTTSDLAGAAIWALPDRWQATAPQVARLIRWTARGSGLRGPLVMWGLSRVEHRHPRDRHLYLAVLGVDTDRQGAGIGSALLQPGLGLCDGEGLSAYLETAKERNLSFYGRHGFEVIGEMTLPKGPPVWLMRREPRGA